MTDLTDLTFDIFFNCLMIFFLTSAEEKERLEWQRNLEAKKNESLGKKETEVCANNPILVYKHPEFLWYLSVFWFRSICRLGLQIVLHFFIFVMKQ
jgi:hypothetical protein